MSEKRYDLILYMQSAQFIKRHGDYIYINAWRDFEILKLVRVRERFIVDNRGNITELIRKLYL